MDTIETITKVNETYKNKVFLIDAKNGNEFTFSALYEESCKIAEALNNLGLKKGDRIVFSLENSTEFAKLYFACLYAGLVSVPLNPVLSASQKDYIITHSAAKMIVFSDDTMQGFTKETLHNNAILSFKLTNSILTDIKHSQSIDLGNLPKSNYKPFKDYQDSDDLIIIYTSGTTSNPKGVIHTLKSIVENATEFCALLNITSENRFYNNLSMTYLGGYYNLMLLPFCSGASVVLNNVFDAKSIVSFWDPIIKYNVNTLWIVPTVISILSDFDRGNKGVTYCKTNIKLVLTGTAPLYESVREKFEEKYSLRLIENYALSETLFITSDRIDEKRVSKSVGKILPQKEVKIINNANEELPVGEEGEIVVKTSTLMKGYFKVEDPSLNIDPASPWFYSGDIGFKDSENNLYVTGRKKDLIIRGGINISPKAIEDVIIDVPGVLECAVVGLPNNLTGEDIVAVVKLEDDYIIDDVSKQVMAACTQKLSTIQLPAMVIELADFPKTSSNKIQKNKIKTWVEEKMRSTTKPAKSTIKQNNPDFFKVSNVVGNSIQAVSIRYNNLVYEMQKKGIDVTVLSLGEAFFDIPLFPFDDLPMPAVYHYTHSRGIPELRENLNIYFKEHFEFGFNPEKEIVVTAGSKIAIHMVIMALINPGDEVIIHEPAWVSYPEQIKLCYGVPVQIPYDEDVLNFEKYITNRTKLIIINSPNNPSGKLFSIEELSYLNKLAKKYNLFILSDEAYSDFTLKSEPFISLGNLDTTFSHSIVVNSISKNYGISGWRLGYIITNEALTNQILKLNQHLITCPPTILQYYIAKHFAEIIKITKPQILAVVEKRNEVQAYLKSVGLTALEGSATFYLFVSIAPTKLGSEEFCTRLLNEKHICIVPGIGYGKSCDSFVRLSIGTESMDRIKAGINEIKKLIDETR